MIVRRAFRRLVALSLLVSLLAAPAATAAPKVIVVSLDGATPRLVDECTVAGPLDPTTGLGADPKLLARAQEALADGRGASAAGDLQRAVSRYRKAWENARRALGLPS